MSAEAEILATVSAETEEKLDRFTESHGLEKNYVIEQALLHFMEAFVPARIVLEDESFDRIAAMLEQPPAPRDALRELMRGERD